MDRFFMRISLGYPSREEEVGMIYRFSADNPLAKLGAVAKAADITALQKAAEGIYVDGRVAGYIVDLVRHTRGSDIASLGVSPRGALSLYRASQAWALYNGRDYVAPDDVIEMSGYVLEHRVILSQEGKLKQHTQKDVIANALAAIKVPVV